MLQKVMRSQLSSSEVQRGLRLGLQARESCKKSVGNKGKSWENRGKIYEFSHRRANNYSVRAEHCAQTPETVMKLGQNPCDGYG